MAENKEKQETTDEKITEQLNEINFENEKKEEPKTINAESDITPQETANDDADKVYVSTLSDEPHKEEEKNELLSTDLTWEALGVKQSIIDGLFAMNFMSPSKIQTTTFPLIVKEPRNNLVAQAKNGSGKTAAFGLGSVYSVDEKVNEVQVVVFAHTRELVNQIAMVLGKIAAKTNVTVSALLSDDTDMHKTHIMVMTPACFEKKFLAKKEYTLKYIKILVLDEADFMLQNSQQTFDRTFKTIKKDKLEIQVLFFSATFTDDNIKFIKKFFKGANYIQVKKEELSLKNVRQMYAKLPNAAAKVDFVEEYLKSNAFTERVIIFINERKNVVQLQRKLLERGYQIHLLMGGDMDPKSRDETIRQFNNGEIQILITTNLLSRGYDEKLVKLVINFELPKTKGKNGKLVPDPETYLHRIGRTGRFGTKGVGLSLCVGEDEVKELMEIANFYKCNIEEIKDVKGLIEEFKKFIYEN